MAPKKPLRHYGETSWWTGKFKTLCGQVFPPGTHKSPWLVNPKCPDCEAILAARKTRKRK